MRALLRAAAAAGDGVAVAVVGGDIGVYGLARVGLVRVRTVCTAQMRAVVDEWAAAAAGERANSPHSRAADGVPGGVALLVLVEAHHDRLVAVVVGSEQEEGVHRTAEDAHRRLVHARTLAMAAREHAVAGVGEVAPRSAVAGVVLGSCGGGDVAGAGAGAGAGAAAAAAAAVAGAGAGAAVSRAGSVRDAASEGAGRSWEAAAVAGDPHDEGAAGETPPTAETPPPAGAGRSHAAAVTDAEAQSEVGEAVGVD
jgi:hypothetical protein